MLDEYIVYFICSVWEVRPVPPQSYRVSIMVASYDTVDLHVLVQCALTSQKPAILLLEKVLVRPFSALDHGIVRKHGTEAIQMQMQCTLSE